MIAVRSCNAATRWGADYACLQAARMTVSTEHRTDISTNTSVLPLGHMLMSVIPSASHGCDEQATTWSDVHERPRRQRPGGPTR